MKMTNKDLIRKASTKELAEMLARYCRCAVVDFEYSDTRRCREEYWEDWLEKEVEQCDT